MELLLIGLGSLLFAGFAITLGLSRNLELPGRGPESHDLSAAPIPAPTLCTELDLSPYRKHRGLIARVIQKVPQENGTRQERSPLSVNRSTPQLSGQVVHAMGKNSSGAAPALPPDIRFSLPLRSNPANLTFHSPDQRLPVLAAPRSSAPGAKEVIESSLPLHQGEPPKEGFAVSGKSVLERFDSGGKSLIGGKGVMGDGGGGGGLDGFPGNGGFNNSETLGNGSGNPTTENRGGGGMFSADASDGAHVPGGSGGDVLGNPISGQGNLDGTFSSSSAGNLSPSPSQGGNQTSMAREREVREIPGIGNQSGAAASSSTGSTQASSLTQTTNSPSSGTRPVRPLPATPVAPTLAAGGNVAAGGASGGVSAGGTPMISGGPSSPPDSGSVPISQGSIDPLPPASIPVAPIGGGSGGSAPASGGFSGPSSSLSPSPPSGTPSLAAGQSSSPSGANAGTNRSGGIPGSGPAGLPPLPFVIPPVAGGGAGAAGGVAPAGIPVEGSTGTPPPSSPASSPPSGEYSYNPPGTTGGSGGSSPGAAPPSSSTPSGNPVPILAPLVPVVPIGGAGSAGGGAAAPGIAPPVGGTPRLPNASEEESDTERDSRDNLPTQCIPWVVQKGQTIHSLAASVGTTPDVIFEINKTTSIVPGQTIRLPAPILIPCCE